MREASLVFGQWGARLDVLGLWGDDATPESLRERSTLAFEPRGRRAARRLEHATGHFTWQRISPKRLEIRQDIEDLCV